ncbi:MAG: GntR family transcriptional regulator [Wenzhouxiangella sp.]|nr:GntR family transcriptional regulator [Wenzhouxiangella sp.]
MAKEKGSKQAPRYLQVCNELVDMIRTGDVPVGDMLPTELELCERFEISRHTAREALRRVEDMGLVERKRGSGTRVTAREAPVVYNQYVANLDELMQYGQATRLALCSSARDPVPGHLASALACKPGDPMLHLVGLRSFRDHDSAPPICVTEIWIPRATPSQAKALLDLDQSERALYRILDFSRLSRVRQTLSADNLNARDAQLLAADPDSAALVINRRYHDLADQLILMAITTHPKERFRYSTELTAHGKPA